MDISGMRVKRAAAAPDDFATLWRERLAAAGSRPFVTYYDVAADSRVELSYPTFGNWLAKAANLLQDDVLAGRGDRIAVAGPPHWLTAVWAVAPLLVGAAVEPWGSVSGARAVAAGPDQGALAVGLRCGGDRFAICDDPMGRSAEKVPEGYRDLAAEVRVHGDRFAAFEPPDGDTAALIDGNRTFTHRDLVRVAVEPAAAGRRPLVEVRVDRFNAEQLVQWLYAPLASGGAVVLVRGADKADLDRIAVAERTDARVVLG